ncbi:MAG: hypothetical protein WBC13_06375 [Dokdonella sp.]
MKSHGGKREGAGKPTQYDKPMRAVEVTLDEEAIEFYKSIGNGNLSKGIREHWRGLTMLAPDKGQAEVNSSNSVGSAPCG